MITNYYESSYTFHDYRSIENINYRSFHLYLFSKGKRVNKLRLSIHGIKRENRINNNE